MTAKQTTLPDYFERSGSPNSDESDSQEEQSVYLPFRSKSLFDQPMSWTRVKDVYQATNQRMTVFDVESDLKSDRALKRVRQDATRELSDLLFDPEDYRDRPEELSFKRHSLKSAQLLELAKKASQIRRTISREVHERSVPNNDEEGKDCSDELHPLEEQLLKNKEWPAYDFEEQTNPASNHTKRRTLR